MLTKVLMGLLKGVTGLLIGMLMVIDPDYYAA